MDALGLTYDEVVRKIPYRNLVIMQRDKLRPVYGAKVEKISGRDMAARRRAKKAEE